MISLRFLKRNLSFIKNGDDLVKFVYNNDHKVTLEKYRNCLLAFLKDVNNDIYYLETANEVFKVTNISFNVSEYVNILDKLNDEKKKLNDAIDEYNIILSKKQDECNHSNLEELNHDSHYTFYYCPDCGLLKKE